MDTKLIFIYYGESGLFNTLSHIAHKIFSPQTYSCNLCAITNSALGMRKEWKQFINGLEVVSEFLHEDEFKQSYGTSVVSLPIILIKQGNNIDVLVSTASINQCSAIDELKKAIITGLQRHKEYNQENSSINSD